MSLPGSTSLDGPDTRRSVYILGTRGIPAAHGGFETFAERFALHLAAAGWDVSVYCQQAEVHSGPSTGHWRGIKQINIPAPDGALGTVLFDQRSVAHAMRCRGVMLVLGYNTAVLSALLRFTPNRLLTNMDGIEWRRRKWSMPARVWLRFNEAVAALTSHHLIADHPEIASHLRQYRRAEDISVIPYGADAVSDASTAPLSALGVMAGEYYVSIARIEPENHILEIVRAYTAKRRRRPLLCLGRHSPTNDPYHRAVQEAASETVIFPGAIYDPATVSAIRYHATMYCHGHSVGGTNPSLVEALGAGNAVLAHDNKYNRWVAGPEQLYFSTVTTCAASFDLADADAAEISHARMAARARFLEAFQWPPILAEYEALCHAFSLRASDSTA